MNRREAEDGDFNGPGRIHRLPVEVVNRIAAGEVIHRPASALKELLENAIDAGSTNIVVSVKDGGSKLLQVQDNGHGIREADLPILCERHTTSKLRSFEELEGISTLGFRGEALASISFVAHLTVTTMLHDKGATHALRATYLDGKLVDPPAVPCAGVPGTTILVEDLFFNMLTRKRALKSAADEYSRVLDVVGKYAVFKTGVGFTCKKHGDTRLDLHTNSNFTRIDAVRAVHGAAAAKHLVPLEVTVGTLAPPKKTQLQEKEESDLQNETAFTLEALVSNANYSAKKTTMVLFINDRMVDCPPLKRACEAVYATLLPKADKPFLFLNLHLPHSHVDVNTHPTKKEVSFLHCEEVVETIQRALEEKLLSSNSSRTFYTQTLMPSATPSIEDSNASEAGPSTAPDAGGSNTQRSKAGGDHKLVRTDSRNPQGSLDAYLRKPATSAQGAREAGSAPAAKRPPDASGSASGVDELARSRSAARARRRAPSNACGLTSVQELCAAVDASAHQELTNIFRQHVFVGMADDSLALIQHKTRLYLVQVPEITRELVYQQVLRRFGMFGTIRLSSPANVTEVLQIALDHEEATGNWSEADGSKEEIVKLATELLCSKAPLLQEYFAIQLDGAGNLKTLPVILDQYTPDFAQLPTFLLALANEVNWETEKECFQSVANALAEFYCMRKLAQPDSPTTPNTDPNPANIQEAEILPSEALEAQEHEEMQGASTAWTVQHTLFPAARLFLQPPTKFATNGTILQVACLEQMYKVFERC